MKEITNYIQKAEARYKQYNLKARPLNELEVKECFDILTNGKTDEKVKLYSKEYNLGEFALNLIKNEVLRGTFPSSYKKAKSLTEIISGAKKSDYLTEKEALEILINMNGGAATPELVELIEKNIFKKEILKALENIVLVNETEFIKLTELSKKDEEVKELIKKWAEKIFAKNWKLADKYQGLSIKVGDFITTGHLSPSSKASSRTDKPLHATYIMQGRPDEEDFTERLAEIKAKNKAVFIVGGEGFGEGSSRKSATYTVLQVIGNEIEGEPENKTGGVVIAKSMAPIFKNSLISSAVLPIICNTDELNEKDEIVVDILNNKLIINNEKEIEYEKLSDLDIEKLEAGGVNNYSSGNELQMWAINYCVRNNIEFDKSNMPYEAKKEEKFTPMNLVEKIVAYNRLDGKDTMKAGEKATVKVRGVFSQDTTGPMTMDEYQAMAGGKFGARFVVQSLCHTCEAPSVEERDVQKFLVNFTRERGGVGLKGGEGIIHTIGNRFVLPTDIIVGGDSHTRTPRGVSFPAASDLVASCMKYGKMDMVLDKVVKVVFEGELQAGMTARDMVSMLVMEAEAQGFGKGVYSGTVIEMYGVENLSPEDKYILTNAVAERSASAGVIAADESILNDIKKDLEYLKNRPDAKSESIVNTIKDFEEYLENPLFLEADEGAKYKAEIVINMSKYKEPIVAKPHHPDNVAFLSEVANIEIDESFVGSCVGGEFESIKGAANILKGNKINQNVNFVVSPASEDIAVELFEDGATKDIIEAGGIVIMSTCGLCMGNKRRIGSGSTAITTTTRNYQGRVGPADSKTYLGSSLIATCCAILGRFPTVEEYMEFIKK
ncbi:MAG: aconitase [Fusobacteriia bacterium 4572_132]|nr:MAG: aconitase [Fusobacteriia bacterium 4572_132]